MSETAKTTKQMLQERFASLNERRDAILAQSLPLRQKRDDIKNAALAEAAVIDAQIAEIEKDLPTIDTDRGMLARALGGRSMSTSNAVR